LLVIRRPYRGDERDVDEYGDAAALWIGTSTARFSH
jgi:hypothetical protein